MNKKEQILEQVANLREPYYLNDVVIVKHALEAMQLYSDQQNKELRERIAVVLSDSALGVEIQRLTTENKELEEKLMSEQIENGYLQAFRVSNESEIQRLTKERDETVAEFKRITNDKSFTSIVSEWREQQAELTRLRELVTQYLDNSTSDNAYGADVRDRILNELNPKRAKQKRT